MLAHVQIISATASVQVSVCAEQENDRVIFSLSSSFPVRCVIFLNVHLGVTHPSEGADTNYSVLLRTTSPHSPASITVRIVQTTGPGTAPVIVTILALHLY